MKTGEQSMLRLNCCNWTDFSSQTREHLSLPMNEHFLCTCRSSNVKWWHLRRSRCFCSLNGPTPPLCPKTPSASSLRMEMTSDRICSSCRLVTTHQSPHGAQMPFLWLIKGRLIMFWLRFCWSWSQSGRPNPWISVCYPTAASPPATG